MTDQIKESVNYWKSDIFDLETRNRVKELEKDEKLLFECFYKNMTFGTGGMRGVMDAGTNRLNKYTLGLATQALSNYLNEVVTGQKSVVIAYDCRNNNTLFANIVAQVLSANGIKVYLFEDLRPTPQLSYAVRYLKCSAGIVITASHNPPEYNGYKVYWSDGAQIVPPHDKNIIDKFNELKVSEINFDGDKNLISTLNSFLDQAFWNACINQVSTDSTTKDKLNIVFSSLHGTSINGMPQVLEQAGFSQVHIVQEQAKPNGNFPTVKSPNPEEPAAFAMSLELAKKVNADICIATDPDADRIGVAVRNLEQEMILLNGNQTAAIMTYYLCNKWKNEGKINGKQFIGTTIVTSPILIKIAESFGVHAEEVLTGFKWLGDAIKKHEGKLEFIGGGEESFGYMVGDFVRDKDSISCGLLMAEIANECKSNGTSVYEYLIDIYKKYGFYQEHLIAIVKKGVEGEKEIAEMLANFRSNPPKELGGSKIVKIVDIQESTSFDLITNKKEKIQLPKSNVLLFYTEDGSRVAVRPSGTEPKIKFYFTVNTSISTKSEVNAVIKQLNSKIKTQIQGIS